MPIEVVVAYNKQMIDLWQLDGTHDAHGKPSPILLQLADDAQWQLARLRAVART